MFILSLFQIFLPPSSAFAWNIHQKLMPFIFNSSEPRLEVFLNFAGPVPCDFENKVQLQALIDEFKLNPAAHFSDISEHKCGIGNLLSMRDILLGNSIDEPDAGMDRDLPVNDDDGVAYDPKGERRWMGGTTGLSSQGFRHMYFGGWRFLHPLITFQIPFRPIGQAPDRVEIIATQAKELLKGNHTIWGMRTLTWAMHYIQDLSQPFHAVQVIHLTFPAWEELLHWPFSEGIQKFVQDTTHVVSNYHLAYEDYVESLIDLKEKSPFHECLSKPEKYSNLHFDPHFNPKTLDPKELAQRIAQSSVLLAERLGKSEVQFFGEQLKQKGVDIAANKGVPDFAAYAKRPDLSQARKELHEVTCQALANASLGSRALIEWAMQP